MNCLLKKNRRRANEVDTLARLWWEIRRRINSDKLYNLILEEIKKIENNKVFKK